MTSESAKYLQDSDDDNKVSSGDEWDQKSEDPVPKKKKKKNDDVRKKKAKKLKSKKAKEDSDTSKEYEAAKKEDNDENESLESDQEYEGLPSNKKNNADADKIVNPGWSIINSNNQLTVKRKPNSKNQADPLKFLKSDKDVVEIDTVEESSDDEEIVYDTEQRMNIREAFANDDVLGDFVQEKKDLIEKMKPKSIDLTLPGWGEWGGAGLTVSKKKRNRFTKEVGPAPKRKDERIANVIISEARNKKLAQIQVRHFGVN